MKSFRSRVVWSLLALVAAIQVATVAALVLQTNRRAEAQAGQDLLVGARVLEALLQSRAEALREAVQVLVADYGFKEAATLNDADTLVSALDNSAARVDAQLAILLDNDGRVLAATVPRLVKQTPPELYELAHASDDAPVIRYFTLGDTAYMMVGAKVKAPTPVATAVLGFAMDAALAERLSSLLQYRISFALGADATLKVVALPMIGAQASLTEQLRALPPLTQPIILHDERDAYMTWVAPLPNAPAIRVVLQKRLEDALAPYKSFRVAILAVAVLALLLAIPFSLRLAKQISRPLEKLAGAARRIEAGDYTERVEVDAPREFVRVASTLDSMQRNIAEREQRIRYQATHDELTGMPNLLFAMQTINDVSDYAGKSERGVTLLVLELKDFDQVQASFGFAAGNAVLVETARRLTSFAGRADTMARIAEAQFLLIAPGTAVDAALIKARQLVQAVRSGYLSDGVQISIDAHVGIAAYPEHGERADELERRAGTALFDAKERNEPVAVYDPARDQRRRRQLALLGDLRRAINADELALHYQPKIDMRSHAVVGVEALVRWLHPEHGRIPPDEFVPIAERTGNLGLLTAWVLRKAIWQMREWSALGLNIDVSVNLSANDLADADLADNVSALLREHAVAPSRLVLEVTESAVLQDAKRAIATMERLRIQGVRFSIDDYGTGFSSLAQLKHLPVDELKIDKSFVLHLQADSDDAKIVRSTVDLGHHLGMKVVAEGVETAEGWRLLLDWGCDLAQGYLISQPVAAEQVLMRVNALNEKLVLAETPTLQLKALSMSKAG